MIAEMTAYIHQVNWLLGTSKVPSWEVRGVEHGFEGKGYVLSPDSSTVNQVHGNEIISLSEGVGAGLGILGDGDGIYSDVAKQKIAVKTADCVPILILSPKGVMALHAGWRGLCQNILGKALDKLVGHYSETEIAIGPCIGLDGFEVGPEVVDQFRSGSYRMSEEDFAFSTSKGHLDRWHLDLAMLAILQVYRYKIPPEHVYVMRTCTKKNSELFHSYRRDGAAAGRNWSWIAKGE